MKVTFNTSKTVVLKAQEVIPAKTITLTEITILSMLDNPVSKTLDVQTRELGSIRVYSGQEYVSAGQWTDTDVINKIKSMY